MDGLRAKLCIVLSLGFRCWRRIGIRSFDYWSLRLLSCCRAVSSMVMVGMHSGASPRIIRVLILKKSGGTGPNWGCADGSRLLAVDDNGPSAVRRTRKILSRVIMGNVGSSAGEVVGGYSRVGGCVYVVFVLLR